MFGDGITHGRPVSSKYIVARQPSIATTSSVGADAEVLVEQPRQLADRHAVAHRDRKLPDERLEAGHEHRRLRRRRRRSDSADRRRSTGTPCRARGAQAVRHRVDVGVDARADVLQIDDQHVEVRAASRRSARASRCRASRPARGAARRRACGVSIMLSCTSDRNPCCGPKIAASVQFAWRGQPIDDVAEPRRRSRRGCRRGRFADRESGCDQGHRAVVRVRGVPASAES